MSETPFDAVVIGSGPGGYRTAVLGALRGLRVAIVEKAEWGGCCLNRGCVPKKAWYHSAQLVQASRGFAARGLDGALTPDLGRAWVHQRRLVETVRASYTDYLKRLGVVALRGAARLGPNLTVAVNGDVLAARHIVLATGGAPRLPAGVAPVAGKILTTDMLFDDPVPAGVRVAIVGGGVIATEFAFILRLLGKEVQWFSRRAPLAASSFSTPALATLRVALQAAEVAVQLRVPERIAVEREAVALRFADGTTTAVDWVLLATGRHPATADLDLAQAGVQADAAGFIKTDAYLATTVPHIFAIGDCVAGAPMTANQALADAATVVRNILRPQSARREPMRVPEVIYSAVELARVGLTETAAEDAGHDPAIGFAAFETNPRALGQDEAAGFVRLIADMDDGRLLGGEIVGHEAGELVHLLCAGEDAEVALKRLAQAPFNHPARAEEVLNAVETLATKWGLADQVFGDADV